MTAKNDSQGKTIFDYEDILTIKYHFDIDTNCITKFGPRGPFVVEYFRSTRINMVWSGLVHRPLDSNFYFLSIVNVDLQTGATNVLLSSPVLLTLTFTGL